MKTIWLWCALSVSIFAKETYTNALIHETSPYLLEHAHNPVQWYPWGSQAIEKAKKEKKLIFLSIGYSTCHWCKVMEQESFSNPLISSMLNQDYVAIKVDKEEYPQLDKKYQRLYRHVHGKRGGWPLSIFLSPSMEVIHLATYVPREEGYGSEGLLTLLPRLTKVQHDAPALFQQWIDTNKMDTAKAYTQSTSKEQTARERINAYMKASAKHFDVKHGAFYAENQYPEASKLSLLLDIYRLSGDSLALTMAEQTLKHMAEGGIYDQVEGGFFRFATDSAWQIPHFEKMLYTNGEMLPVYIQLMQMTGERRYLSIVRDTIAHMEQYFVAENVYLSASHADSEGDEGGYFTYSFEDVTKVLLQKGFNPKDITETLAYLGIEEDGNVDGDLSQVHITGSTPPTELAAVKTVLLEMRHARHFPFVDTKVITAWNAMMIKALFQASMLDPYYLSLAKKRLQSLLTMMYPNEILYHQVVVGKQPKQKALLEDYAFLIDALLAGYEQTHLAVYLSLARSLSDQALVKFYRQKQWYWSDDGVGALADFDDKYYTSALSMMLDALVRMTSLTGKLSYRAIAQESIDRHLGVLETERFSATKLLHTVLRLGYGDVTIHASEEALLAGREQIRGIRYPFVLTQTGEGDEYLACKISSCFAQDRNLTKLIEQIERTSEPVKKLSWGAKK